VVRARSVLVLTALLAVACGGPPIPQAVVEEIASSLSGIAHPNGTYVSAEVTGWSKGSLNTKTHDRYVDVAIRYDKGDEPHTMDVRLYVENLEPCRISIDVLQDDGPKPILLDNALSSAAVGNEICKAMTP
jgi:hypothetical protein